MFVYQRVCEEYLYIHPWCEEAVYRAPIQNVQTDDRQTQHYSISATVSTVG